ncbi:MAG: PTS glucose transporter subunit IIA [Anaerorhabdus sp.]
MGLFKKKGKILYAMANGQSVPIESVPDEVFSTKMMGNGIAIVPEDGNLYAPCDGEISMVMEHTLHAVGLVNDDGMEILLHIGLDTIELMGEGFRAHVSQGDYVHAGDLLIDYDKEFINEKKINDITMLVIVEENGHTPIAYHIQPLVQAKTSKLIEYK